MSCRVPLTWLICISLRFDRRAPKRRSGLDRNCANKHPHAHLQNSQLDTRIHEIIYIYIYIKANRVLLVAHRLGHGTERRIIRH
jgi:hypothetical protein